MAFHFRSSTKGAAAPLSLSTQRFLFGSFSLALVVIAFFVVKTVRVVWQIFNLENANRQLEEDLKNAGKLTDH